MKFLESFFIATIWKKSFINLKFFLIKIRKKFRLRLKGDFVHRRLGTRVHKVKSLEKRKARQIGF